MKSLDISIYVIHNLIIRLKCLFLQRNINWLLKLIILYTILVLGLNGCLYNEIFISCQNQFSRYKYELMVTPWKRGTGVSVDDLLTTSRSLPPLPCHDFS
jgi:hypothetical protein